MTSQERQIIVFLLIVFTTGVLLFSIRRIQVYQQYVQIQNKYPTIHETSIKTGGNSTDIEERDKRLFNTVHVNSADVETLIILPGIGRETAMKIIEYRSTVGPFTEVADLLKVHGIGDKKLEKIKKYIVLD
jgi:competence ComEA-like helix-hairpin-helix protein